MAEASLLCDAPPHPTLSSHTATGWTRPSPPPEIMLSPLPPRLTCSALWAGMGSCSPVMSSCALFTCCCSPNYVHSHRQHMPPPHPTHLNLPPPPWPPPLNASPTHLPHTVGWHWAMHMQLSGVQPHDPPPPPPQPTPCIVGWPHHAVEGVGEGGGCSCDQV